MQQLTAHYKLEERKDTIALIAVILIFEIQIVDFRGNFLGLTLTAINALDLEGNF